MAFLVGSWLYSRSTQQKNEVFDPGAQEMPRFNQALRGATMPVLFGTNRVSSNVVWTKNFTTIRHESGGNSGSSGSNLFSSGAASGGGEVTYEYKWDLMFHLGMVPEPYSLFGGWTGSDRLNSETILAITNGGANLNQLLFLPEDAPDDAALNFTEGYFSPGPFTGDTDFVPWAYFTAQEGTEHWFPSTVYVGFKQLSLGGQPVTPQLTFEVGPGSADLSANSQYISKSSTLLNSDEYITGGTSILGDDGKRYVVTGRNVICVDDGTTQFIAENTMEADASSFTYANGNLGGGSFPASFVPEFLTHHLCGIAGQETYFLGIGIDAGSGSPLGYYFILYKINSSGSPQAVGAYFAGGSPTGILFDFNDIVGASVSNLQTNNDPILVAWQATASVNERPILCVIPSINTMINTPTAQTDSNRMDELSVLMDAHFGDQFFNSNLGWGGLMDSMTGWFLPSSNGGTHYYVYVNRQMCRSYVSGEPTLVGTYASTYPDGFIGYLDLGDVNFPADDVSFTFSTAFTIANDLIENFPFEDAGLATDDTTAVTANDYWTMPTVVRVSDVALTDVWIIIFTKQYSDTASRSPTGTRSRTRAFFYNPFTGAYTSIGQLEGFAFDTVSDLGMASGNRYNWTLTDISTFYFQEDQSIVVGTGATSPNAAMADRKIFGKLGDMNIAGGGDVLPPYIIKQILTNSVFGLGYATSTIDDESYQDALDYCDAEDIRVSTQYLREEGALRIIELLLSLYGGFLIVSGGKIKFGRQEVTTPVRTIDNHHLVRDGDEPPVKITRGALQDAANKIKVNYIDRALQYRQNFVEIEDPVDIDINGVRTREFPPQFVMSEATARKLAVRALWAGLYARDQYSFTLGPKDSDLEPGDVITLQDSFHAELSTGVYTRLTKMRESKPGRYEWIGVTEYADFNSASLDIDSSTLVNTNILFGPAKAPLDFRMYELPKEFQGANPQLFVGWVPAAISMGARLWIGDGTSFARVADIQPYIIAGRLQSNLASTDLLAQGVEVYLFPSSGFSASSPTFTMTHALDDVSQAGRAVGAGLMWAGSEMLAYQGVTLLGQNRYRFDKVYRGWGGTYIHAHSVGDYWWKQGGGVFSQGYNEDKVGTTIYYKVTPYNFSGVEYNVASIDAKSYSILGTYYRPQDCPAIHTYVDTPLVGTRSEDLRGLSTKGVTSGGCKVYLDWSDASRIEGHGQGGYGDRGYGHFATDTTSHSWRVEVSSSNGFVVRSVSVSTSYYEYDRPVNSADFNGWKGAFNVRVTPYNSYGDALISGVKSLNLFG